MQLEQVVICGGSVYSEWKFWHTWGGEADRRHAGRTVEGVGVASVAATPTRS